MFCKNCGSEIPENTTFCPNCGANQKEEVAETFEATKGEVANQEEIAGYEKKALVFGILSLVFALELGILLVGAILAIVFASKANGYIAKIEELGGELQAKAKVGKGLAKAGKIVGIVMIPLSIIIWVVYIVGMAVAISSGEYEAYYAAANLISRI